MKKMKLQTKILATTIASIICLAIGVLVYFYIFIANAEQEKSGRVLETISINISRQFDSLIYNMDGTALQIAANPYVVKTFGKIQENTTQNFFDTELLKSKEIRDFISTYNFSRNMNLRVCMMNEKGDFVQSGTKNTQLSAVSRFYKSNTLSEWNLFFSKPGNYSLLVLPREDPYNDQKHGTNSDLLFSVVRPIKDNQNMKPTSTYGYVEVQKSSGEIDQLFSTLPPYTQAFVFDENNNIFLQYESISGENSIIEKAYAFSKANTDYTKKNFLYSGQLVCIVPLERTNLTVALITDYRSSNIFSLWKVLFFTILIILAVFCFGQYLIIHKVTKPLKTLHRSIKSISLNNLSLKTEDSDELIEIETAFNEVLHHLQLSIDEQVESKTREVQSFLMALQAQMNPHFLYNILSIISMAAEENKCEEISEMCGKLSKMLRFTASYNENNTLQQEIDYTMNYLSLMKVRYEERFEYTVMCEQESKLIAVPKLIIQPFVENCFKHAFPEVAPPWRIGIRCFTSENKWFVEISDNGIGFNPDYLKKFEEFKTTFSRQKISDVLATIHVDGICISNIFVRLKILYKENLEFDIMENSTGGSTIIIGGLLYDSGSGS